MVSPSLSARGIAVLTSRRKHPVPWPLASGARQLARQTLRQCHPSSSPTEVLLVLPSHCRQMRTQRRLYSLRQRCDAVLPAFATPDGDLPAIQGDVLDAQLATFEKPKARAIQKLCHQPKDAAHLVEEACH